MLVIIVYVAWILEKKVSPGYPFASFLLSACLCSSMVASLTFLMLCVNPQTIRYRHEPPTYDWPIRKCSMYELDNYYGVIKNVCRSDVSEDWHCAICLDDSVGDGEQLKKLVACKHVFHKQCIDQWIVSKPFHSVKCPLCRRVVFDAPIDRRPKEITESRESIERRLGPAMSGP